MDDDRILVAKLETTLESLDRKVTEVRDEVRALRGETVSRGEWVQRNSYVDAKFDAQGTDITDLRTEMASRRAPWWAVAAVLLSTAALLWNLIGPAIIAL